MPTDVPKRRWFQFRLRTLLGLVTLAGIGMALIVAPAERQRRAVVAVRAMEGLVAYDRDQAIDNGQAPVRTWLGKFFGKDYFETVTWVELNGTQVTDARLEPLKGLTALNGLLLGGTQLTDAGLKHLKGLTRLSYLDLGGTQVTDVGLAELQRALPDCAIFGP